MQLMIRPACLAIAGILASSAAASAQPQETRHPQQITIIYDAFGRTAELEKDWGFAALIEYGGRRILFDTGNKADIFTRNVDTLGVDLTRLDAVVISHRHGDHTTGLSTLIARNRAVPIYAPQEGAMFKSVAPRGFIDRYEGELPATLRYFDGREPERWSAGTPWEDGNFHIVTRTQEILPGFFVLTTRSQKPGTMEMNEVSLAIRTPEGLAVVVGCSHPGVERILQEAARIEPRLYTVTGGFHLVQTPRPEIERVAGLLHDDLRVARVAPGHCTSELGFRVFMDRFGARFDHAGVGAVLSLP
jgi:7,8-dihydropterin-6-yl-methyl-4-(beta-D-ribofuranosyl)aminobenzene 5'-phosphate synthase